MTIKSPNIKNREWICDFTNTQGGTLIVGIKDNGEICRVQYVKKLLKNIPIVAGDMLDILININQKERNRNFISES